MNIEHNPVLSLIKEVRQTADIHEIMALFAEGNWIMIEAGNQDGQLMALMGRYK